MTLPAGPREEAGPLLEKFDPRAGLRRGDDESGDIPHTEVSRLQSRRRFVALPLLAVAATSCCGYLVHLGFWRIHLRRFAVIHPDVLYRSAQPTQRGMEASIDRLNLKTVVCLRRENAPLSAGPFDLGEPDGLVEGDCVKKKGVRFEHWPMGGEAYWPWFGPEQFEAFFNLLDDPANLPVMVHCIGGRHRTGTFMALYRQEYDRWPIERALREMYSFDFGHPIPIQEHNLRTYSPRPRPDAMQWQALCTAFAGPLSQPKDYPTLLHRLRSARSASRIKTILKCYLEDRWPFSLCLAQRLVDSHEDPLAPLVCDRARECLKRNEAAAQDWTIAAALIADFGDLRQQHFLLAILENEPQSGEPSTRYRAAVIGVTNRFTPNRIPFLRALLEDLRPRPEPSAMHLLGESRQPYRYCDTAVARLCAITDMYGVLAPHVWEESRQKFLQWYDQHPQAAKLIRLGEKGIEIKKRSRRTKLKDRDDYRG